MKTILEEKYEIIKHKENSIHFVQRLGELPNELWREPIEEEKWSIAEIIGHLAAWDRFIIESRIPYVLSGEPIPKAPDVHELNAGAALKSRNSSKKEIINEFVAVKRELIELIGKIEDHHWTESFKIGNGTLTLYEYFTGLSQHDYHHFEQIMEYIKRKGLKV